MSNKIIHKHSSVVTDGNPKIPTSSQLSYGELAINYADGVETISFKNSNNEIVEIKTKNYFDNQIDSNSEKIQALEDSYDLIVSEIENNELVTATAITNLEERTTNVENGLTQKSDVGHTHSNYSTTGHTHSEYAPKSHASSSTTYGVATSANYGHVKISNGDVATVASANGLAAGMDHSHSNYSTTGHTHGTITLSGDVTGSASIGSGTTAVNITATVTDNSHNHISANISDSISEASGVTSATTGLVQGKVIYNLLNEIETVIEDNELVTATAITNLEERTTNVENGLTQKSDVGHTHTSADISDSISTKSGITSTATGLVQGKSVYDYAPPKSHASSSTTYGVATSANYGHVKISNGDVATVASANGLAAGMDHSHSNYSRTGHTHNFYDITGIIHSEVNGTLNITQTGVTLISSAVIIPIDVSTQYSLGHTIKVNFSNPNNLTGYVSIQSFQNNLEANASVYNLESICTINTNGPIVLMYIGNDKFRVIYNDYDKNCDTYTDYAKKLLEYNYCTCTTASSTSAKTASISGFILSTGVLVLVDFTYDNTATSPTLNINNTGAKYIRKFSGSESVGTFDKGVYALVYDGTQYQMLNCYNSSRSVNLYTTTNSDNINYRIPFMHKGSDTNGTNTVCTQQNTTYPLMFNPSSGVLTVKTTSSSSDERLKNFKNDINIDFNKLKQIPKKYFTWKYDDKEIINIGTSAQEVEKIYPELVHEYESENNEQYKSIEYQTLSVIALAAIDKLHERIEYLENKIKEYETK